MIVNLTPHTITILFSNETWFLEPSGTVARCKMVCEPAGHHDGIPLTSVSYGTVEGLPEPAEGVLYVVSALVKAAVPGRNDVASPGDLVRDASGNVIGCRGLNV